MKTKKIISLLLALITVLGSMNLAVMTAFAADTAADNETAETFDHLKSNFASAEERVAAMTLGSSVDGCKLYYDDYSGEIAFVDKNGEILLSNPYNIGASKASNSQKYDLLSQIIVKYTDNGTDKTFTSYEQAALRNQISVERIKNGIRVEYSLGNEETRILTPRQIEKGRFEELIISKIKDSDAKKKLLAYYSLKDASKQKHQLLKEQMYVKWPATKTMAIYVISSDVTEVDLRKIESTIKEYCPDYTFAELDFDHKQTLYEGEDREPANFKMAIEYTIDGGNLVANLPANGIRYNEKEYTLSTITILPYMGAGTSPNEGYTFLPDGSGAIFRFEDLYGTNATTVTATVYGTDYAYQTIKGAYEQTVAIPVFGLVENEAIYKNVPTETEVKTTDEEGNEVTTKEVSYSKEYETNKMRGFAAIIEEGEAMAELATYHGGNFHEYNTVKMTVTPRPKDSYNLATAISVGSNSTWTVVSERRYTGNYQIRYITLTDPAKATEQSISSYYETTWKGMAEAYRDYLEANGVITRLTSENTESDIPLYIETFGATTTTKKILSIPVTVMTALTSFEDIETMYAELSSEGVKNINFKLTGYANGGMNSTMPYKLKWEKAVGGKKGFKNLLSDAKEKGYGVYPDFDFAYINNKKSFDGVTLKKHAVKSIDNRYTSKRVYSAARQNFTTYYQLAVSPAYYYRFIDKLATKYTDYDPIGISVATLGYSLNSDFDKKEPYNREDGKNYTADAFGSLSETYGSVMTEGGNAYTLEYVDHILGLPLDSSRYIKASYTVPFIGYVLHGYKNFTGDAINMAGDIRYEILKCIENGASMYFILSYDNTEILKEDEMLSKYYSIRYDIWKDDVVSLYTELNEVLAPLQTKLITDHEFLIGERIPDTDETPDTEGTGKYRTMDDGRIVRVEYEDGTTFLLNYNYFAVTVLGTDVPAYGYVRIK